MIQEKRSCFNCANLNLCYQRRLLDELLSKSHHLDFEAQTGSGKNPVENLHRALAESCTFYEYREEV